MKSWKWQLVIALVVVFFAGMATGLFAGARHAHFVFMGRHGARTGERMRAHMQRELRLTPEQSAQISPIIDRTAAQLEVIRKETSKRVAGTFAHAHQEMLPLLNPEQRERLEEMKRRHRHMLQSHDLPLPEVP
jgi:Spy/CpxP family protein refolding chaperone